MKDEDYKKNVSLWYLGLFSFLFIIILIIFLFNDAHGTVIDNKNPKINSKYTLT